MVILIAIGFLLYFGISKAIKFTTTDAPVPEPPKPMEFIITDASIMQFDLTSDNTLYYHFKLNINVTNPEYIGIFTRSIPITAISSYKGNKFAVVDMESLTPQFEKTILLKSVVFYGNSLIKLNVQQLMEYHNETRLGIFNLDLILNFNHHQYAYCIGLGVPLISNVKLESTFNVTKCSREYQGWG
ncbi:uncharacterized protein LOC131619826 [Vicia villosa]|uniref:uncharacterized protein LOC131619826 n=1 Tax=Vicia villosa TaxID=3911 RepID=UPI00273C75A3|nr:uncharacterized protein LOC131619826 [Vicia villosa]